MDLEIIYQDDNYVAINKPSGLLVHKSPIDRHETRFAIQLLKQQLGQLVFPVHRLDKPTSGVLLFAMNKNALKDAQQLFQESSQSSSKAIFKTYHAIVRGHSPQSMHIDHPVKAQIDKRHPDKRNQLQGITDMITLAQTEIPVNIETYNHSRYSLVALKPLTGRRHQLRYHMKHISHPIIGDAKYGRGRHNRYFSEHLNCPRLLLAATSLSFIHPYSKKTLTLNADPGLIFRQTCNNLQLPTEHLPCSGAQHAS